ncbi:Hypothetical predicted protein, partial [Pelobates cultripes]
VPTHAGSVDPSDRLRLPPRLYRRSNSGVLAYPSQDVSNRRHGPSSQTRRPSQQGCHQTGPHPTRF